jgi:hypothetical protein
MHSRLLLYMGAEQAKDLVLQWTVMHSSLLLYMGAEQAKDLVLQWAFMHSSLLLYRRRLDRSTCR